MLMYMRSARRAGCVHSVRRLALTATATLLLGGPDVLPSQRPGSGAPASHQPGDRPALVVLIVVDQMRADYFTRFFPQLTGGLGELYRGGAVFTRAYQDHAITETAPGHSAMMSGRFPVHTGITTNALGVVDTTRRLVGAPGVAASPFRFRGTTLADWLRAADSSTRVLSVSRKDRGAILPVGRGRAQVFWYAANGTFTTSTYYADTLPSWLRAFNDRRLPHRYAGQTWGTLLAPGAYPEPDSVPVENGGNDIAFPHRAPADTAEALRALPSFPWMDQLTLEAALAGVRALDLGGGARTDFLSISLSTTDAVGHAFGPDSRELHDQILRLDRSLGAFLDTLFTLRDRRRVVIALTADHGVAPFPEVHGRDANPNAVHVDLSPVVQRMQGELARAGVPDARRAFRFADGVLTLDRPALAGARIAPDSLVNAFRIAIRQIPGVLRTDRIPELARADTVRDAIARRWLHMFASDSLAALVVTLTPYSYWGRGGGAQHGSPHEYDAHVPVLFYGTPFRPGKYGRARVVDMAPTLARVLGIRPTEERLDGRVLTEALR